MKAKKLYRHEELEVRLSEITDVFQKIDYVIDFIWYNFDILPVKCKELANWATEKAVELNYEKGKAYAALTRAYQQMNTQSVVDPAQGINDSLAYFLNVQDHTGLSRTYNMIAYGEWWKGNYTVAVDTALKATRHAELSGDLLNIGWTNYAMGVFYNDLKDLEQAIGHFRIAIKCAEDTGERFIHARALGALGTVYIVKNDLTQAEKIVSDALIRYQELAYESGISRALNDLAVIEKKRGNYRDASELLNRALRIRRENNFRQGVATTLIELGALCLEMKQFERAFAFLDEARLLCESLDARPKLAVTHGYLSDLYKLTGEPWKALEHLQVSHAIRETVSGEQAQNKIKQLQTTFATEKAEKEKEIERLRNVELKQAYDLIEQKNKDILDSINYARRIQLAILPSAEELKKAFSDAFFLYIPREVVSGDFYWYALKEEDHFLAAVDCTGHGVPGAFMSMIGNALLNEIVIEKGITAPSEILSQLREGVIKCLKQTGADGDNQDGMDIALVRYRRSPGGAAISYSGANNALWVMRAGDLLEVPPAKQPIGVYHGESKPFRQHEMELLPGDKFFLFTDGFADQFGGEDYGKKGGKKFKYSRLKELLLEHRNLPMPVVSEKLKTAFEKWKGELEQTDDVLVIGVRVS